MVRLDNAVFALWRAVLRGEGSNLLRWASLGTKNKLPPRTTKNKHVPLCTTTCHKVRQSNAMRYTVLASNAQTYHIVPSNTQCRNVLPCRTLYYCVLLCTSPLIATYHYCILPGTQPALLVQSTATYYLAQDESHFRAPKTCNSTANKCAHDSAVNKTTTRHNEIEKSNPI